MTKKILIVVCAIVCCLLVFVACDGNKSADEILGESVSSRQTLCYGGVSDDFDVTLTTLSQEEAFVADGKVGKMVTRTTLVIKPKAIWDETMTYSIASESGKIDGSLSKNVLGSAYVAEISDLSKIGAPTTLTVTKGSGDDAEQYEIALENKMADVIDSDEAIRTAYEFYKQQIDAEIASEDGWQREIFVRYVGDRKDSESKYYWYVAFVADRNDDMSVLIDPATKEIVNSRVRP